MTNSEDNDCIYEINVNVLIKVQNGNYEFQVINDDKNNSVIKKINKEISIVKEIKNLYNIHALDKDNNNIKILIDKLSKKFNEEKINDIKNKVDEVKYIYDIKLNEMDTLLIKEKDKTEILKNKLYTITDDNEKQLNEFKEKYKKDMEELYEEKLKNKEELYEEKLKNNILFNNFVDETNNNYITIAGLLTKTNISKGKYGEDMVYNTLKNAFGRFTKIDKVNGEKNCGDIYIEHDRVNAVIEVKNHDNTISSNVIEKFISKDIYNENYNSGIFISLKSNYNEKSNIKHFDIKYIDNKPIIFLCNVENQIEDINSAVIVLNNLLKLNDEYKISDIQSYITKFKRDYIDYTEFKKDINNMINILKNLYERFIKKQEEIKLFNVIEENIDNKCPYTNCSKSYKHKNQHYYKHIKECKYKEV